MPQNARDEYLFAVRDEGYNFQRDYGAAGVRISRTASAIDFHTDSSACYAGYTPDIVSLLALQTAKAGGMTALVSAQTVHNILRQERPDCLRRLYQPFYFDRRAEMRPGDSPTLFAPVFSCDDTLAIRFFRFNLLKGHETAGVPADAGGPGSGGGLGRRLPPPRPGSELRYAARRDAVRQQPVRPA